MSDKIKNLTKLFNPDSIAVVGASRDEKKIGHVVLKNIVNSGFRGQIFPINPKTDTVAGLACFADYKSLPITPDLAILAVPAELAMELLKEVGDKGTKNVVILSAGFKEIGLAGEKLEKKLAAIAGKYGLHILGPNCLGFLNTTVGLNATFSKASGAGGNLRFISQSGAFASAIFDWAQYNKIGFSEFITLGNKTIINENDIFHYWLARKKQSFTESGLSDYQPIGMYLESISSGKEFLNLAAQISAYNPVFILKPGKSARAKQAISSHTGSLAGDDAILDTAFKEAGVIRCETVEDMFDLARVFSWENAPRGPKVAIVSNAGGPAVASADILEKEGLQMANLSKKTLKKLREKLPAAASILNPVDVLGDALSERYAAAIASVLAEKETDALLVILTPQIMTEIEATAEIIGNLAKRYNKSVVCSFLGGDSIDKGEAVLNKYKIPSFRFPERAIKALARMWQWRLRAKSLKLKVKSPAARVLSRSTINKIGGIANIAQKENRSVLSIPEADKILNLVGIKTQKSAVVKNLDEALKFAQAQGWPMVLKISSPAMLHKTDQGGVIINIDSPIKLDQAWKKITQAAAKLPKKSSISLHVQKQAPSGVEMIVGVKYDEGFGNVLLVGAGGVLAELMQDKKLKLLPLDERGAVDLLVGTKAYALLKGFRGQKPVAIKKLIALMVKVSQLAQAMPWAKEITINPVVVGAKEAIAVDTRIILKS